MDNPGAITVGEVWSLFAVALFFTSLRLYARVKVVGIKGLQVEDYLAVTAMAIYSGEASIAHTGSLLFEAEVARGAVLGDAPPPGAKPSQHELEVRSTGHKLHFGMAVIYPTTLWLLKVSILRVLARLTAGLAGRFKIVIKIGFIFLACSYVTIFLTVFLSCRPFLSYFDPDLLKPDVCKPAGSPPILWTTYSLNIITDFFLIAVPMPLLWNTSMKMWKKIGLVILFSAGGVIIIFATIRVSLIQQVIPPLVAPVSSTWAVRESFVAIITTNFPMVFTLVRGALGQAFSQFRTTTKSQSQPMKPSDQTFSGSSVNMRKPRNTYNPTSTNAIFTESEENMVKGVPSTEALPIYSNVPDGKEVDIEMTAQSSPPRNDYGHERR